MFIDRVEEMSQLNRLYESDQAEFYVLYGRRRVGKTELLREFCQEKPHIFFIATLASDAEQLATFSQQVYSFTHSNVPLDFTFPSWEAVFVALADLPSTDQPRPIVVLDEFTYLINGNQAIPSILQKVWDEYLKNSKIMLILCGSYIGMMETEVLGHKSPLYGRRTGGTLLRPLDLPSAAQFFPHYSPSDQFLAWAVLGGMPYYLRTFAILQDLFTNISQHILNARSGSLFAEPRLLLMEELREPRNYFSILRAIAQGRTRLNEIVQTSGVGEATSVARYLDILQQMRIITRTVPVTEYQPEKSKKGVYQIDDHFLRFWFRYVHPNQASLDLGLEEAILNQRIRPDLDHFAAMMFEEAAQVHIASLARKGLMPFLPERIGKWWDREAEIDVMAMSWSDKAALIGECKWSQNVVGINVLSDLKQKAQIALKTTGIAQVSYALFSRMGFTQELEQTANDEGVGLYTVAMLVKGV